MNKLEYIQYLQNGNKFEKLGKKILNKGRVIVTNTYDASDEKTFEDAYSKARKNGNKTFVWNNEHYNTDYSGKYHKEYEEDIKSGKASAWEKEYPNYTNPNLRKAKQEELDTYGITNEQTADKSKITKNIHNSLDYFGYDILKIVPAIFNIKLNQRRLSDDIIAQKTASLTPYINYYKNELVQGKDGYKKAMSQLENKSQDQLDNDKIRHDERRDLFNYLMGTPIINNSLAISKFKPKDSEHDYYIKVNSESRIIDDNLENASKYLNQLDKWLSIKNLPEHKRKYIENEMKELSPYLQETNLKNQLIKSDVQLGDYTLSDTKDFKSYYDLWDINPLGQGSDKTIINLGTPINIYNRIYKNKKPNIDFLYENFNKSKNP